LRKSTLSPDMWEMPNFYAASGCTQAVVWEVEWVGAPLYHTVLAESQRCLDGNLPSCNSMLAAILLVLLELRIVVPRWCRSQLTMTGAVPAGGPLQCFGIVTATHSAKVKRLRGNPSRSTASHFCRQTTRRWPHSFGLQHSKGVHAPLGVAPPRWHADVRQDFDWQDNHARCRSQ